MSNKFGSFDGSALHAFIQSTLFQRNAPEPEGAYNYKAVDAFLVARGFEPLYGWVYGVGASDPDFEIAPGIKDVFIDGPVCEQLYLHRFTHWEAENYRAFHPTLGVDYYDGTHDIQQFTHQYDPAYDTENEFQSGVLGDIGGIDFTNPEWVLTSISGSSSQILLTFQRENGDVPLTYATGLFRISLLTPNGPVEWNGYLQNMLDMVSISSGATLLNLVTVGTHDASNPGEPPDIQPPSYTPIWFSTTDERQSLSEGSKVCRKVLIYYDIIMQRFDMARMSCLDDPDDPAHTAENDPPSCGAAFNDFSSPPQFVPNPHEATYPALLCGPEDAHGNCPSLFLDFVPYIGELQHGRIHMACMEQVSFRFSANPSTAPGSGNGVRYLFGRKTKLEAGRPIWCVVNRPVMSHAKQLRPGSGDPDSCVTGHIAGSVTCDADESIGNHFYEDATWNHDKRAALHPAAFILHTDPDCCHE